MTDTSGQPQGQGQAAVAQLPVFDVVHIPGGVAFWSRVMLVAVAATALLLIEEGTYVFLDYWLMQSLGFENIFWTNFEMGASLYVIGFLGTFVAVAGPAVTARITPAWRQLLLRAAVLLGLIGGYLLAMRFQDFLLWFNGGSFGKTDPVFGHDIGFYVFSLPAIWTTWMAVTFPMTLGLASSLLCTTLSRAKPAREGEFWLTAWLADVATPYNLFVFGVLGILGGFAVWLARYDLLWANNEDSMIMAGAEYLDVTGILSTLNSYYVTAAVMVLDDAVIIALLYMLHTLRRKGEPATVVDRPGPIRKAAVAIVALVAIDLGFALLVTVRDVVAVVPNEPVIQLPYIERHIDATLEGYDLKNVETVTFTPHWQDDPVPDPDSLLQTATMKNAPLWPGWVSYLEDVIDLQHINRIIQTDGDKMVYGPVLEILRQEQKLRMYYNFLDVDTVRYRINGDKRMFVSAVRELPMGPNPWLYRWAQRLLNYTHGYGLVMAPVNEATVDGGLVYVSHNIPTRTRWPEVSVNNEAIYYGEGGGMIREKNPWTMAYSNARNIEELDHPTDEGEARVVYPASVDAGVRMDSWLKRFVIGWRSGAFVDTLFTGLVDEETRVHFYRTPIERAERVARFLYFDTNKFAFANNGGITWLVNGMVTSDRYPYSTILDFGDKAEERSPFPRRIEWINYVRDAVKITLDAYTGKLVFYRISDDPVTSTWASIYPGLFTPGDEMPASVRDQIQYPVHLFHTQFDDVYKRYHMTDPLQFFNTEDLWDDADEVFGPVLDEGEAITFSIEPYNWMAETDGEVLPATKDGTQFALSMVFTNEQAWNLRAIPTVYQDGDDYGRIVVLQVPKGEFYLGPEQADAEIDQDREITQKVTWWNRMGAEVIQGHTATLVIGREVVYLSPLFIRSAQNPVPQLKLVIALFRGHAGDGNTVEEAIKNAIKTYRQKQAGEGVAAHAGTSEPAALGN